LRTATGKRILRVRAPGIRRPLAAQQFLRRGIGSPQRQTRHRIAGVVDGQVGASCQLQQESRTVERQMQEDHTAGADGPRGGPAPPWRRAIKPQNELISIADLQRAPGVVTDQKIAVSIVLVEADPKQRPLRVTAEHEASVIHALVDPNLPLADIAPEHGILRKRARSRAPTQQPCKQKRSAHRD